MSVPPAPSRPLTFTPLMKPGPALPTWPPAGYRGFYKVGDKPTMNWQTVAWSWGIPDVRDLIWFNFRTEDPWQVNYYMHRYLGCTQSNDGRNFSFREADPGFVYIPPLSWKRPDRLPLGVMVADTLSSLAPHFPPYVTYQHVHVSRTDLLHVVEAIRSGRIVVRHDPSLKGAVGEYDPSSKPAELILKSASLTDPESWKTLVHEAVHVILDMKGYSVLRWKSEFIAYAIEAQFTFSRLPSLARRMLSHKPVNEIHAAAIVLGSFTDAGLKKGKASIRLEDYDRLLDVDPERRINPFENLKSELLWVDGALDQIEADGI